MELVGVLTICLAFTTVRCHLMWVDQLPILTRRNGLDPPSSELFVPVNPESTPEIKLKPRQLGCRNLLKIPEKVKRVFLSSPGYPNNYPPRIYCNYTITSPIGTQMRIICDDFEVPCKARDEVRISPSGDPTFSDVKSTRCGAMICTFANSTANKLGFSLKSRGFTTAHRRFQCEITVTPIINPLENGTDPITTKLPIFPTPNSPGTDAKDSTVQPSNASSPETPGTLPNAPAEPLSPSGPNLTTTVPDISLNPHKVFSPTQIPERTPSRSVPEKSGACRTNSIQLPYFILFMIHLIFGMALSQ